MKKRLMVLALGIFALAAAPAHANAATGKPTLGEYVARASNCIACHTADKGPYAGGVSFGSVISPNITPDNATGIGRYDFAAFERAVRQGISPRGLMSVMMPPSYAIMTDVDVHDLYEYFMHDVRPVSNRVIQPDRPMIAGHARAVKAFAAARGENPHLARGRYLVEGLGHCGFCHTPRNAHGVEKAQWADQGKEFLSGGGKYAGWIAVNLRGDHRDGLARRSVEDLTRFFLTGRNDPTAAFGKMIEVVESSTQYLTYDDALAVARFLKSLPAKNPGAQPFRIEKTVARRLRQGKDGKRGAAVYVDSCASCHKTDGSGYKGFFPELRGNPVIFSKDPLSLIHIVLVGQTLPGLKAAPSSITMPPLGWRLDDRQIADVLSFIRSSWGNKAPAVSAGQVRKVREDKALFPDPRVFGNSRVDKLLNAQP